MEKSFNPVKSEREIEYMRQAAGIGDKCFEHLLSFLKVGRTEIEIASEIEKFLLSSGGERLSFDVIVGSGGNGADPHAVPTDKKLEHGDLVVLDFGCVVCGFAGDMSRTVVMGEASDTQRTIYNTVLKAQLAGIDAVKAGESCFYADKSARDVIEQAGYGKYFVHSLGHGVGRDVHEHPSLSPKSKDILLSNTVVTVEPGIYIEGFGGVRIEDMGRVFDYGFENFSTAPKELIII